MKRQLEALNLVWPKGIPTQDYEKALRLVDTYDEGRTAPVAVQQVAHRGQADGGFTPLAKPKVYVGKDTQEKVRAALATGPATCTEIAMAIGMDPVRVNTTLRVIGAKVVGTKDRIDGQKGQRPRVWALPTP